MVINSHRLPACRVTDIRCLNRRVLPDQQHCDSCYACTASTWCKKDRDPWLVGPWFASTSSSFTFHTAAGTRCEDVGDPGRVGPWIASISSLHTSHCCGNAMRRCWRSLICMFFKFSSCSFGLSDLPAHRTCCYTCATRLLYQEYWNIVLWPGMSSEPHVFPLRSHVAVETVHAGFTHAAKAWYKEDFILLW